MSTSADWKTNLVKFTPGENFDDLVLNSDVPMIVDFYADWCGPCVRLGPIIEEHLKKKSGFKIVKVNVDENPDLSDKFGVSGIPHVILFKAGKIVATFTGLDLKALQDMINTI